MHLRLNCVALLLAIALPAAAQDFATGSQIAFARAQHLKRGINVSHWFSQNAPTYSNDHLETEVTADDIALIARLGFDNVRLSIDAAPLGQAMFGYGRGPSAEFLSHLDAAVDNLLAKGLAVQIDLHPEENYKQSLKTDNQSVDRMVMLWRGLAARYANRDPERVFFEIMNEPEVSDPYRWAGIQARVAAAIREVAPRQTIIATGPNYSNIEDLLTLEPLPDGNVIYNFHFYDPHTFTHQGATWAVPWWSYTHSLPYPATESSMQELLKQVPDAAGRYQLEDYWLGHWDAHRIRLMIDAAAAWGKANKVPLICNEFGAYRRVTDPASRNAWIHDVRSALEADGIGWAMWDFHGGFDVAPRDRATGKSVPDPLTVEALGLK